MRVAVLITGQPRYLEEGAWWLRNKVFPQTGAIEVDYYCYFWNDGSDNLAQRIQTAYNPKKYQIGDYDSVINNFINKIQTYNKLNPTTLSQLPNYINESILFNTTEISTWSKNFWGQYLASGKITDLVGNLADQNYDIIIKTRSDAIFVPMQERLWLQAFSNMHKNTVFQNKILPAWLYIDSGIVNIGDFVFFSLPNTWYNYSKNIEQNCLKLATINNVLFSELGIAEFQHPSHWVWTKLSLYTKSNWLSFGTVWPTPFAATLLRKHIDISTASYKDIEHIYNH
jgi:hypothetical protein